MNPVESKQERKLLRFCEHLTDAFRHLILCDKVRPISKDELDRSL